MKNLIKISAIVFTLLFFANGVFAGGGDPGTVGFYYPGPGANTINGPELSYSNCTSGGHVGCTPFWNAGSSSSSKWYFFVKNASGSVGPVFPNPGTQTGCENERTTYIANHSSPAMAFKCFEVKKDVDKPDLWMESPTENEELPINQPVTLKAKVIEWGGMQSVQFIKCSTITCTPLANSTNGEGDGLPSHFYTLNWTPTELGSFRIKAQAKDVAGNLSDISLSTSYRNINVVDPTDATITTNKSTINVGESTNLKPVFGTGTGVIDQGVGAVNSGSSKIVSPTATTKYTLTVTNLQGIKTASQMITVNPVQEEPPTENYGEGSSISVSSGPSTSLSKISLIYHVKGVPGDRFSVRLYKGGDPPLGSLISGESTFFYPNSIMQDFEYITGDLLADNYVVYAGLYRSLPNDVFDRDNPAAPYNPPVFVKTNKTVEINGEGPSIVELSGATSNLVNDTITIPYRVKGKIGDEWTVSVYKDTQLPGNKKITYTQSLTSTTQDISYVAHGLDDGHYIFVSKLETFPFVGSLAVPYDPAVEHITQHDVFLGQIIVVGPTDPSLIPDCIEGEGEYCLLEKLPGFPEKVDFDGSATTDPFTLGKYLNRLYQLGIAIAGVLGVVMIVVSGVMYMTTDSFQGKSEGKKLLMNAIGGVVLALLSWIILNTLNPSILNFNFEVPKTEIAAGDWGDLVTFNGVNPGLDPDAPENVTNGCDAILKEAQKNADEGLSSCDAPGTSHGVLACVWFVDTVIGEATGRYANGDDVTDPDSKINLHVVGLTNAMKANPNDWYYVGGIEKLKTDKDPIDPSSTIVAQLKNLAQPGDIIVSKGGKRKPNGDPIDPFEWHGHAGICETSNCERIISNQSASAKAERNFQFSPPSVDGLRVWLNEMKYDTLVIYRHKSCVPE